MDSRGEKLLLRIKNFIQSWSGHGYEKGETQKYWLAFLRDVFKISEPEKILLSEVAEKFHAFDFLIDANKTKVRIELELSLQAGEIVAKLYDALREQYLNPKSAESLQSLNKLCVRLVFCLYAESAGIFGKHKIFRDYLREEKNLLGDFSNPVKVSINQFFGIEINDFAVSVAQTALWIAELQMAQETSEIIHREINFLPLKNFANIFEGNALSMDWKKILPHDINFIFGNPPFVGKTFQTPVQKSNLKNIFVDVKNFGILDYVCAWYKKATDFIAATKIECAFVSTNSITQGEQVMLLSKIFDYKINFAFRTFRWDSESSNLAHVHCVIIGFANFDRAQKKMTAQYWRLMVLTSICLNLKLLLNSCGSTKNFKNFPRKKRLRYLLSNSTFFYFSTNYIQFLTSNLRLIERYNIYKYRTRNFTNFSKLGKINKKLATFALFDL